MDNLDLSKLPSAISPPGVTSNLASPPLGKKPIFITAAVCALLVTVAVSARLYTKVRVVKKVHLEDCE